MKIKICGLFNSADIDYVNEALPDYIGFVFAESRRKITPETAREFKKRLDPRIKTVGVFVNADITDITRLYADGVIDIAQLHGSEGSEYIENLKKACGIKVIKAVNAGNDYPQNADFLLFDNGKGGTGEAFDWKLLPKTQKPFFLAGGINLNNIEQAVKQGAYCIDLSSGVETDGKKDREKILKIVKTVRGKA